MSTVTKKLASGCKFRKIPHFNLPFLFIRKQKEKRPLTDRWIPTFSSEEKERELGVISLHGDMYDEGLESNVTVVVRDRSGIK